VGRATVCACTRGWAANRLTRKPTAQDGSGPDLRGTYGEAIVTDCWNGRLLLKGEFTRTRLMKPQHHADP